jgi:hypothetical protein
MLIHRQNSYAPRCRWSIGRREAQSGEPVNTLKKTFCIFHRPIISFPLNTHSSVIFLLIKIDVTSTIHHLTPGGLKLAYA